MASISPLNQLEHSLRETLRKEAADNNQRKLEVAELQKQVWEQHRQTSSPVSTLQNGKPSIDDHENFAKDAVASMRAKEIQIEKRKSEAQVKVKAHLTRLESEGRRLDELRRELEGLEDPTKKEVADVRKKIESVDRDLKPLKQLCERKEKELKEAVELFNEKNKLKSELVSRLMEIVTSSERQRMQKLDEINKHLESMENCTSLAR